LARKQRRAAVRTLVVAMLALVAVAALAGTANARPRCFGAASRDPDHRCVNKKLRKMVSPTPARALLLPPASCSPIEAPLSACTFGTSAASAGSTVALVGDSHAEQWRSTLWPVTKSLRWAGVSLTHASCPLTRAVPVAPAAKQADCAKYNRDVTQWLADHPEVGTIFTGNHPGRVVARKRRDSRATMVAGIVKAWKALPATVEHIVVIRDDPFMKAWTLRCVTRAIHKHRNAGRACTFSRKRTLHVDPYVIAARKVHSPRVQVIDLTHFFCGRRVCYPVVGGALVYKDAYDHVTAVYARTLAPYLLGKLERLMASWR
jgi:SGNH domain (fused to AT3 domains)